MNMSETTILRFTDQQLQNIILSPKIYNVECINISNHKFDDNYNSYCVDDVSLFMNLIYVYINM